MKHKRIKASLCAYTYKDKEGKTQVQIISHNITKTKEEKPIN